MDDPSAADMKVDIGKIKKLIKCLKAAFGNDTSISVVIPLKEQISRVSI